MPRQARLGKIEGTSTYKLFMFQDSISVLLPGGDLLTPMILFVSITFEDFKGKFMQSSQWINHRSGL
jgi:hypothetical protein